MILATLLQAASGGAQQTAGSQMSFWIMIIAVFAIMYFFMIRPQRKQQKEIEKFRNGLKKGDKVVTAGGIYGTIADIDERTVLLKVDGNVKIRVDKSSIGKDYSDAAQAAPAADNKKSASSEEVKEEVKAEEPVEKTGQKK